MNNKIVAGIVGTAIVATGIAGGIALTAPEKIELNDPQVVVWEKPTTDAGWAEDVKAENFDIKSTEILKEMVESHTEKLKIQEDAFAKYAEMSARGEDPVAYLYWQYRDILKSTYPKMGEEELDAEARKAAQEDFDRQVFDIEKVRQSIERMNKELELRSGGFVEVEGEKKGGLFGDVSSAPPERIRKIND